jgi:hypothetical protein
MIDKEDADVIEFLLEDSKDSNTVNFMIQTRGGSYRDALDIHKLLNDNYKSIKSVVINSAMSCGTALSVMSDELYLHPLCKMGAFDPQLQFSPAYPPTGLYRFLKDLGINSKDADTSTKLANSGQGFGQNLINIITDAHKDYYAIEEYVLREVSSKSLVSSTELDPLMERFFKDTHPDYKHHGHRIDFQTMNNYIAKTQPLAVHNTPKELVDLFVLCETLLNQYNLTRIYVLNDTLHMR